MSPGEAAGESDDQRALARSRILFLTSHALETGAVRTPILASWRRSRDMRVAANEVNPILEVNPDLDTFLSRAAAPVLQRPAVGACPASRSASCSPTGTGWSSPGSPATRRWSAGWTRSAWPPASTTRRTRSAPTASVRRSRWVPPTHVFGHEHYAERLEDLACAGVPIKHPLTGRTVGAGGPDLLAAGRGDAPAGPGQDHRPAGADRAAERERHPRAAAARRVPPDLPPVLRDRARRERRGRDAQRARPHRAVGGGAGEPADPRQRGAGDRTPRHPRGRPPRRRHGTDAHARGRRAGASVRARRAGGPPGDPGARPAHDGVRRPPPAAGPGRRGPGLDARLPGGRAALLVPRVARGRR